MAEAWGSIQTLVMIRPISCTSEFLVKYLVTRHPGLSSTPSSACLLPRTGLRTLGSTHLDAHCAASYLRIMASNHHL